MPWTRLESPPESVAGVPPAFRNVRSDCEGCVPVAGARRHRIRAWWIAAAALATIGIVCQFTDLNRQGFLFLHQLAEPFARPASALSVLGLGASGLTGFALLGLRRRWCAAAGLLVVLLGGLAVQAIKALLDLPRPLSVLGSGAVHVIGNALHARAMPSGHAAMLAALATLAWVGPGRLAEPSMRRPVGLAVALTTIAIAGATARVIVGAHWPADVLIGAALGVLAGGFALDTRPGAGMVRWLSAGLDSPSGARVMALSLILAWLSLWRSREDDPFANDLSLMIAGMTMTAALLWGSVGAQPGRVRA